LHDNYERELRVRDVAAQVHMSERHASRLFRQATGTPIRAYLQRLRLDVAATLLAERELSVKEIAHSCGYPDVRHFTTAFRLHHGMTPAAFRAASGTRFTDPARQ
ncbi:MAG: helix-turn-helix transcriptional regulator, partial [Mycobacterium sp.]|nr:helix-turn-helix transcriptional regulator [Mycobacterium sp.]